MTFDLLSFVLGFAACIAAQWLYAICGLTRFFLVVTGRRRMADMLVNAILVLMLVAVVAWVSYEMWQAWMLMAINVRGG